MKCNPGLLINFNESHFKNRHQANSSIAHSSSPSLSFFKRGFSYFPGALLRFQEIRETLSSRCFGASSEAGGESLMRIWVSRFETQEDGARTGAGAGSECGVEGGERGVVRRQESGFRICIAACRDVILKFTVISRHWALRLLQIAKKEPEVLLMAAEA